MGVELHISESDGRGRLGYRMIYCVKPTAQTNRVSRKSTLGKERTYMIPHQDGFRLFLDDGRVDMDSNLVENAINKPCHDTPQHTFAGHDDGARSWAAFASFIGTSNINNVEPYANLVDLFTKLVNGHLAQDSLTSSLAHTQGQVNTSCWNNSMGRGQQIPFIRRFEPAQGAHPLPDLAESGRHQSAQHAPSGEYPFQI